ncbi:MAG TPA: beta-galactosidase [Phycisphaerae bacterium]|nr:beta-galactosidase [Phycisphaerae bacterium]
MIGGEIHYWRVQRRYWEAILASAKELGVEVIGTYVPWQFHETSEGVYDLSLLEAFLDTVERHGFQIFARPGPFIYAEWRNLGLPDHAVPYHKLHPEFQRKAAHWITAVMKVLKPRLGKSVVMVQADNEIDPMPHYYGEDQGFAGWLRERYETIERLNTAWGSDYRDFDEAIPSLAPFIEDQRFHDSCQYRYDLATRYAEWVVGQYRQNGCNVPILLNTYPGVDAQNWHDLAQQAERFGIDVYPRNECRGASFRAFRERMRLLRIVTPTPLLVEFGSGIWHGMPDRDYTPDHYRLVTMIALAGGVRGWNWYMLVERDNWRGSPINERGVIRPELGEVFKDAVRAFNELKDAPPPETSCAITWSWHYYQAARIKNVEVDDPLPTVLHEMGLEYDFVDVDHDFTPPGLLLVGSEIEDPARLWRYVAGGGNLVFFQRLIEGCVRPDGTSHPGAKNLEVSLGFVSDGPVFAYRRVPGRPITARQLPIPADEDTRRLAELAVGRTYTTGYYERRGKGMVLVLGCPPSAAAILAIHRFLKIEIPVLPLTPGIHACKRGDKIVVLNPGEARTARLRIGEEIRHVDVPRCSGVIL